MIVLLALLNDGPIMMIAYDRTEAAPRPVRWQMHSILSLATALGVSGVFASFGMFWIGEQVLRLDRPTVQTLMFLKLTVAGHMTIYLTRTVDRPFWRRPWPAPSLFWTAEVTQAVATCCAVYGWFMPPVGWRLAGLVWGYALAWFAVNECIKRGMAQMLAHASRREARHLDRIQTHLHPGVRGADRGDARP
jgi:H+-transporting ATPase